MSSLIADYRDGGSSPDGAAKRRLATGRLSSDHTVIQLRRRTTAEQIDDGGSQAATEATTVAMYQVVAGRRQAIDTMMWQVPSLSAAVWKFVRGGDAALLGWSCRGRR
jgi:hypothetical protein